MIFSPEHQLDFWKRALVHTWPALFVLLRPGNQHTLCVLLRVVKYRKQKSSPTFGQVGWRFVMSKEKLENRIQQVRENLNTVFSGNGIDFNYDQILEAYLEDLIYLGMIVYCEKHSDRKELEENSWRLIPRHGFFEKREKIR